MTAWPAVAEPGNVPAVPRVPGVPGFQEAPALLDRVADFLGDYVAFPSPAARDAVAQAERDAPERRET